MSIKYYFHFIESNLQQYLHYLPVPTIEKQECNSTNHYNGHLGADKICAGYTDSEKSPCYVSTHRNKTFYLPFSFILLVNLK